jgi:hypothetical protein
MSDIHATKERWKDDLMSRRGVVGVGVTEKGLIVFIEPCIAIEPPISTCIEGVPVETKIAGKFKILPKKIINI